MQATAGLSLVESPGVSLANPSAIFKNKGRRGGGLRRLAFPPARL